MATTSLQTNLIIRLKEEDFQALEGIAEHIHIPVKDLVHGIISYALDQYSKSQHEKRMNKQRRKEIEDLHDNLQNLLETPETIMEEEEEYKDNLPENMLNRIEQSENAIYSMQEAWECITSAINTLEEIE